MEDRELLERAARAADMAPNPIDGVIYAGFGSREWNPLTDDGDAFRLAVKLMLQIRPSGFDAVCHPIKGFSLSASEANRLHSDPYAAVRRAIVRAAAQMEG